jgi:hypothetical protein
MRAGPVDLMLEADVPAFPNGRTYEYRLGLTLDKDGEQQTFDCTLSLKTMQSFPTMVRVGRPIATSTRKPSVSPTAAPAGKTPTPAKGTPTRTPAAGAAQPSSGAAKTPTPKPGTSSAPKSPVPPTPRR